MLWLPAKKWEIKSHVTVITIYLCHMYAHTHVYRDTCVHVHVYGGHRLTLGAIPHGTHLVF